MRKPRERALRQPPGHSVSLRDSAMSIQGYFHTRPQPPPAGELGCEGKLLIAASEGGGSERTTPFPLWRQGTASDLCWGEGTH